MGKLSFRTIWRDQTHKKGNNLALLTKKVILAIEETNGNKAPGEESALVEHFKHLSEAAID